MKQLILCLLLITGCASQRPDAPPPPDEATMQVQTLVNALDSVEADQAEKALLEIGPKAMPAIRKAMDSTDAPRRARLQRILDQLEHPAPGLPPADD